MLSYLNDKKLKQDMVKEMELHLKQDQFIKGVYSKTNGIFKGCSIGCAIDSLNRIKNKTIPYSQHSGLETELGIPKWLARLNDTLYEGLPTEKAGKFSVDFLKAIPVGVNLDIVRHKLCAFILTGNIQRVLALKIKDDLKEKIVIALKMVLELHEKTILNGAWDDSAWSTARSAAESVARSAAWAAAWSATRSSAWSAAESAAWSAAEYVKYAEELLRLLKEV